MQVGSFPGKIHRFGDCLPKPARQTVRVQIRELTILLRDDGWRLVRWHGAHRQYQHPVRSGTCTISQSSEVRLPTGCLRSFRKRLGLQPPDRS
ncbi:MAG: addiction module toxin, HicA family [Gammaproteobacteria bacterium PRO9]|nr:addiction module toxin, HicA family [Gammaproteobacteria bacterium PRO9]